MSKRELDADMHWGVGHVCPASNAHWRETLPHRRYRKAHAGHTLALLRVWICSTETGSSDGTLPPPIWELIEVTNLGNTGVDGGYFSSGRSFHGKSLLARWVTHERTPRRWSEFL